MIFHVGPYCYRLLISDRPIYDAEGSEMEGVAIESRRLIVIGPHVEPDRRSEVALHECFHCWQFHAPTPRDEEESARFASLVAEQFNADLESAGGRESLARLPMQRVPQLGKPQAAIAPSSPREVMGSPDRIECAGCGTSTMCGSIHTSEAQLHEPTGKYRVSRWFSCEACNCIQTWIEVASSDGSPLGEYISNPKPRLLRGVEAAQFLAEQTEASTVC